MFKLQSERIPKQLIFKILELEQSNSGTFICIHLYPAL